MDKNKFWLGGRLFNTASPRLVAPMQCKAHPQVGRPNARLQCKRKARPHIRKLDAPTQRKARPQVGRPNATQGEFARWSSKRKTHPQRKRPHKGALGKKMSWRMDKNKFWLGGRLFNTASPRLGAPTQRKAHPQVGFPNACLQLKRKARPHVQKLGAPTQRKARLQDGCPNLKLIRNQNFYTREH
jgi:hypothetical protein